MRTKELVAAGSLVLALAGVTSIQVQPAGAGEEPCAARPSDNAVIITETCVDPELTNPYTDKDEHRTITDPVTKVKVSFRYIHGGFKDTDARFSFYFPSKADYQGRFLESTYPTIGEEDAEPSTIVFAISHGAYVVSSNNAGGVPVSPTLGGYRVNAAAAKYSREVAAKIYKTSERPRGYLYGASGGAYQTIGASESTSGVWDGFVPMVPGVPNAIPSFMTVELLALRELHDVLPKIADAMEPGGSGDPYADLDPEQQAILREAAKLGHPLRGWWQYATLTGGGFFAVQGGVKILDASYVDDFWNAPGYEGSDPAVQALRVQHDTTVTQVVGKRVKKVVLESVPDGYLAGADLVITSGDAADKSLVITNVTGKTVELEGGSDPEVTNAIRAGDDVRIDNSWRVALEYYHRHQVPSPDQYGWNQFRDAQGAPVPAQRSTLVADTFAGVSGGSIPTGRFEGKMIMLASTMDVQAYPWAADWYRTQAQGFLGDQFEDSYRLWYMDNADHDPRSAESIPNRSAAAHVVNYDSELQQALLDLDAWVTDGSPPPVTTSYSVDDDSQIQLPASADERGGVQPVVTLTVTEIGKRRASESERAEIGVDQKVTFTVEAEAPPGAGKIVGIEWDFEGVGKYPTRTEIRRIGRRIELTATFTYTKAGTYFPAVRVTSERDGDPKARYRLVQNLGRMRVVVQ
ncbi:MAG: PKD domain-containing protein [Acidimicrobiia bacterium]